MSLVHYFHFKLFVFFTTLALLFTLGFFVTNAQEELLESEEIFESQEPVEVAEEIALTAEEVASNDAQAEELVLQDEDIKPEDLDMGDPRILPDSPLYGFKNFFRGVQSAVTFDQSKKAELKVKFANEKIIEAKKLEENGADDDTVKRAIENYEQEIESVRTEVEKLKEQGAESLKLESVVEKALDSQIKHNKVLGEVMKKRGDIAPDIEEKKQQAMKGLVGSVASLVDPEVLERKLDEAVQNQKGSAFKHFKHVEVLEEVKDFVPQQARGAVENAIKQSSRLFEEEFKQAGQDQRKVFHKYIEKMGGNEVRQLEAFDSLGAFANMEKTMFGEMEKAREKTRKRVETRMRTIQDETRKKIFVAHLENAEFEDARIVKELEDNLDAKTISGILDIKHKFEDKMREKFENAQSTDDLQDFFRQIEDRPDAQMLTMMKQIETIVPVDKKEFFQEMKHKAMSEMNNQIEEARRFGREDDVMHRMAGFDPEVMGVLEEFEGEFGPEFGFFEDMKREQANKINQRFEHMREFAVEAQFSPSFPLGDDPSFPGQPGSAGRSLFAPEDFFEKAEEFRFRIENDDRAQDHMRQFAPQMFQNFDAFDRQVESHGFDDTKVNSKIDEAETMIANLQALIENSPEGTAGLDQARRMLEDAKRFRQDATSVEGGKAFGQSTSALKHATNGIRQLENAGFEAERQVYFQARDQVRQQFEADGFHSDEIPFDELIDFKPPSFNDFANPRFFGPPPTHFDEGDHEHEEGEFDDRSGIAPVNRSGSFACAQVMTPAKRGTTGECRTFPNSCLPPGWRPDSSCEGEIDHNEDFLQKPVDSLDFNKFINSDRLQGFQQDFINRQEEQSSSQRLPERPTEQDRLPRDEFIQDQPTHTFPPINEQDDEDIINNPFRQRIQDQESFQQHTIEQPITEPTREPSREEPINTFQELVNEPIKEPIKEPISNFNEPIDTFQKTIDEPINEPINTFNEPIDTFQEPINEPINTFQEPVLEPIINEPINEPIETFQEPTSPPPASIFDAVKRFLFGQ